MTNVALMTDFDLDGVGCSILLKRMFPNAYHKCQGPGKLERNLNQIIDSGEYDVLVTADLSYPPDLLAMALNSFKKIVYIDHHKSSALFQQYADRDDFTFLYDTRLSSTGIAFKAFSGKMAVTKELATLAMLIDVYDCWRRDHPRWNEARALNELFWHYGFWEFEERFWEGYDGLTNEEWDVANRRIEHSKEILSTADKYEITDDSCMILASSMEGLSSLDDLIDPKYLFIFYVVYLVDGKWKVSARYRGEGENINLAYAFKQFLDDDPYCEGWGGHKKAGGFLYSADADIETLGMKITEIAGYLSTEEEIPF